MTKLSKSDEAAIATLTKNYVVVRAALVKIVGSDNPDTLNTMRRGVGESDATPENKLDTIEAIDALLKTQPKSIIQLN